MTEWDIRRPGLPGGQHYKVAMRAQSQVVTGHTRPDMTVDVART